MRATVESEAGPTSVNRRAAHYDHELRHELRQRQEAFRCCHRYLTSSELSSGLLDAWQATKAQAAMNLKQLQDLLGGPCEGCASTRHDLILPDQTPLPWTTKT